MVPTSIVLQSQPGKLSVTYTPNRAPIPVSFRVVFNRYRPAGLNRKKYQMLDLVLKPFRDLQLDATEFAAFKAVTFLNPGPGGISIRAKLSLWCDSRRWHLSTGSQACEQRTSPHHQAVIRLHGHERRRGHGNRKVGEITFFLPLMHSSITRLSIKSNIDRSQFDVSCCGLAK